MKKLSVIVLFLISFIFIGCGNKGADNLNDKEKNDEQSMQERESAVAGIWGNDSETEKTASVLSSNDIKNTEGVPSEYTSITWENDKYSAQLLYEAGICMVSYTGAAGDVKGIEISAASERAADVEFYEEDFDNDGKDELGVIWIKSAGSGTVQKNFLVYDFEEKVTNRIFDEKSGKVSFNESQREKISELMSTWDKEQLFKETGIESSWLEELNTDYFAAEPVTDNGKTAVQVSFKLSVMNSNRELNNNIFCVLMQYNGEEAEPYAVWFE